MLSNFLFCLKLRWLNEFLHSAHLANCSLVFSFTTCTLTHLLQKTCIQGNQIGSVSIFLQIGHLNSSQMSSYCGFVSFMGVPCKALPISFSSIRMAALSWLLLDKIIVSFCSSCWTLFDLLSFSFELLFPVPSSKMSSSSKLTRVFCYSSTGFSNSLTFRLSDTSESCSNTL